MPKLTLTWNQSDPTVHRPDWGPLDAQAIREASERIQTLLSELDEQLPYLMPDSDPVWVLMPHSRVEMRVAPRLYTDAHPLGGSWLEIGARVPLSDGRRLVFTAWAGRRQRWARATVRAALTEACQQALETLSAYQPTSR